MKKCQQLFMIMILCGMLLYTLSECYGFWIWTPQTGKWINPKYAPKDTAKQQYDWAMEFFEKKEYDRARKEFQKLIHYFPRAKLSADGQYYMGECYAALGYYYHAFLEYQKVIDTYPYSKKIDQIIVKQFEIGKRYLAGERYKSMGVALLPAYMKAGEIFSKVQENAPNGQYAAASLYYAYESYEKAYMPDEALLVLSKLIKDYPQSDFYPKAQLAIAKINLKQTKTPDYDMKSLDTAIKDFNNYLKEHPRNEFTKEAESALKTLLERKAQQFFNIAQFYEENNKLQSAMIYYEKIIQEYPGTSFVSVAKKRRDEIDAILYGEYIEIVQASGAAVPSGEGPRDTKQSAVQTASSSTGSAVLKMPEPSAPSTLIAQTPSSQSQEPLSRVEIPPAQILKEIECTNYDTIAKVNCMTDGLCAFAYYTMDEPFRMVIDPIPILKTNVNPLQQYAKGIIKSIHVVKEEQFSAEMKEKTLSKDTYYVDYIVIEFFKEVPVEVVQKNDRIMVKAGDYLEEFLKMKIEEGK